LKSTEEKHLGCRIVVRLDVARISGIEVLAMVKRHVASYRAVEL